MNFVEETKDGILVQLFMGLKHNFSSFPVISYFDGRITY